MLDADIAGRAHGPAFKIIAQVLNRALGFDLCVCPPGAVAPYAEALDERVAGLFRRLARVSSADASEGIRLALATAREPRTHGGLALRAAVSETPYAYLSTVVAVLPRVSADLEHAGLLAGAVHLALERTGVLPAARGCQQRLLDDGVDLDYAGMARAAGPRQEGDAEPFALQAVVSAGRALRHRRRGWLRLRADAVLDGLAPEVRAHRWAHGGPEGGLGFVANTSPDLAAWDDLEFVANLRRRCRLPVLKAGPCRHRRVGTGTACGEAADALGDHAVQCMVGGDHTTFHDGAVLELAKMHKAAGLRVRTEVLKPHLATAKHAEPRPDLESWGSAALPHFLGDFTLVSPWAARNAAAATRGPARAAASAELAKVVKYGARGGCTVQGLAMESGGRHGPALAEHLGLLASLARARCSARWQQERPWLRDWRTRLAVLLGRFTAQAVQHG